MPATGPPDWDPDDTGAVPLGPEPEPTGALGGEGSGGWGEGPRVEPYAVAALVWAIVSVVLPIVGTIVALVLSARAADAIRRSQGARGGTELVTAARVVAGVVIGLWAIGLVAFVALGGGNGDDADNVAVPTQPSTTTTTRAPTTSTTVPPVTTATTSPPPNTTAPPPPVVTVIPPPPTEAPTTAPAPTNPPTSPPAPTNPPTTAPAPTNPPTTAPGPTNPPTSAPGPTSPTTPTTTPTTTPPGPPTTNPQQRLEQRLDNQLGPSNRGVPEAERAVVTYVPGESVTITWAIDNGSGTLPSGEPTCTSPPPPPTTSTTTPPDTTTSTTTSTSTTSTTTTSPAPTTTTAPADESTRRRARQEARTILQVVRSEIRNGRIDVTGIQLVGTYPIAGPEVGDVDVVQVFYTPGDLEPTLPTVSHVFEAPPATEVQCLNPAFE